MTHTGVVAGALRVVACKFLLGLAAHLESAYSRLGMWIPAACCYVVYEDSFMSFETRPGAKREPRENPASVVGQTQRVQISGIA